MSLADMMNKACTLTADSDSVKDMREKYKRPSCVPFLFVPTVNSSIYKKMSRFIVKFTELLLLYLCTVLHIRKERKQQNRGRWEFKPDIMIISFSP